MENRRGILGWRKGPARLHTCPLIHGGLGHDPCPTAVGKRPWDILADAGHLLGQWPGVVGGREGEGYATHTGQGSTPVEKHGRRAPAFLTALQCGGQGAAAGLGPGGPL